jgi:hypothetical protein
MIKIPYIRNIPWKQIENHIKQYTYVQCDIHVVTME